MIASVTGASTPRRPPAHLSRRARGLWREIVDEYQLERHHEIILTVACEALDRLAEARAAIAADGAYIDGRFGKKAHPALAIERDSRIAFLRSLRELGLDLEFTGDAVSRPPSRWRGR